MWGETPFFEKKGVSPHTPIPKKTLAGCDLPASLRLAAKSHLSRFGACEGRTHFDTGPRLSLFRGGPRLFLGPAGWPIDQALYGALRSAPAWLGPGPGLRPKISSPPRLRPPGDACHSGHRYRADAFQGCAGSRPATNPASWCAKNTAHGPHPGKSPPAPPPRAASRSRVARSSSGPCS